MSFIYCLPSKSWGHLVGEGAGDDHDVGLPWAGPEDDAEPVQVVPGGSGVDHLDGAASQPKRHGPEGPSPGPIHQVVRLRYHVLRRPRRRRRTRSLVRRRRRSGGRVRTGYRRCRRPRRRD